jgi:uncharacterized protein with HEPN domain
MKRDYKLFFKDMIASMDERFVEGMELEDLIEDDEISSAVIRKFEILGEAARNVPDWMRKNIHRYHGSV